nr:reverse transcriptase domain-containing protein [Tanacetum cinerariifolium]
MAGPVEGGGPEGTNDREETPPPLTKEQIEGHVSALKSLIESHNQMNKGDPIRLDFESEDAKVQDLGIAKGKEVMDEDLGKPFKEARRTPLTRRIIELAGPEYKMSANIKLYDGTTDPEDHLSRFASAANSGEWPMPVWCRMFQQTLDGSAKGWFERLPYDIINEWADVREAFAARYSVIRACVSEVMKISSFMDAVKSPELAKRFSNKVPITVNEMMERLDNFVRSEEAYARTKLPRGKEAPQPAKVINVISVNSIKDKKRKGIEVTEPWMNIPISFSVISSKDVSEEPLIVEAKVEGYLVRRVEALRAIPSTIHSMMKFPTLKGVATLVTWTIIIAECRRLEKKQMVEESSEGEREVTITEEVLVNPSFPDQRVTIEGGLLPSNSNGREGRGENDILHKSRDVLLYQNALWAKNAASTYQRLVDSTFQHKIGRNLEAYVDDMVIKSKDEKMLLANIAETFDNLKKINMKLNPKKFSFGVEGGKFLGLSGKLAALNHFLAKSAERSLPFFNTLKNITKENKHEYRWTKETEGAFQQMKNLVMDLPSLTPHWEKGNLVRILGSISRSHRASSPKGSEAGLVLLGPSGIEYTYALRLIFPSTNNEAEYEALLAGLRIARLMNISNIEVIVDFKLVASQINRIYEASEYNMIKYLAKAKEYAFGFKSFSIENIPRNMNQKADVLSKLASMTFNHLTKEVLVEVLNERSTECQEVHTIVEEEGDNWMTSIIRCLERGIWSKNKNEARCLRAKIGQYAMNPKYSSKRVFGTNVKLVNDSFKSWCGRFEIHQMNTTVAHPQANGLVERANRSLMKGIKTRLGREKSIWVDELPNVLWANRTSIKQGNGDSPFSLTYGSEAVIPAEIGIPTYRTLTIREGYNDDEMRLNLDLLQERRETAAIREARYKTKMK